MGIHLLASTDGCQNDRTAYLLTFGDFGLDGFFHQLGAGGDFYG